MHGHRVMPASHPVGLRVQGHPFEVVDSTCEVKGLGDASFDDLVLVLIWWITK